MAPSGGEPSSRFSLQEGAGWWIIGTVVLGAVGSGLWDLVLADVFESAGGGLLSLISFMSDGFREEIHSDIGKGNTNRYSKLPYALIVVGIILANWFSVWAVHTLTRLKSHPEDVDSIRPPGSGIFNAAIEKGRIAVVAATGVAIAITGAYILLMVTDSYTIRAVTFVERSLDIIAPTVEEPRLLRMRQSYRQVDEADEFYALEDTIRAIAETNNLELPEFESIR